MLLVLSEEHKEHLSFLPQVDAAVVGEFGRIALEFLRRGTSPKVYEGAARKLCVPVEMVQHGVEGLMFLMTESSKHMVRNTYSSHIGSLSLSLSLCRYLKWISLIQCWFWALAKSLTRCSYRWILNSFI
uniref:COMM domain containing 2 n=1 Tax=Neolamprologus brichardi TaxID=32507 RepID=A0A3Q4HNN9_NEOBR